MPDPRMRVLIDQGVTLMSMSVQGPATVANGGTAQYTANVMGTTKTPGTWSTSGGHGSINATSGVFTATSTGAQTITFTNTFDNAKTATKNITVV